MNDSPFDSAAWFRAVWLHERKEGLGAEAAGGARDEEAQRLLERWRAKEPFSSTIPFEQRLEAEGLTEAQLRALLTESPEELKRRFAGHTPPWLTVLQEAFSRPVSSEPFPIPPNYQGIATYGFIEWVRPLVERGRARLRAHLQEVARSHSGLLFDVQTLETLLFAGLPTRLFERINRTLVLEMNIARLRGQLKGETGPERFTHFVEMLRDPRYALPLFQEYAVLARLCVEAVERWVETSAEFATRLAADGPALRETLLPPDAGLLVELSGHAGDQHHSGRSVHTLTFASGVKLVYKPRSFGVDERFQELLAWVDARGDLPPFRQLRLLAREGYGWSEFVDARPCESEEGVQRFYQRLGAQLCLFHHVGGMDMHYENLIAEGENPVIVDLETLFHPQISDKMSFLSREEQLFIRMIDYSVTRISMLPLRAWATENSEGVDVGGMGSPEGQLSPLEVPYWEDLGADTMRQNRKRIMMKGAKNLPTLRGENVPLGNYLDSLCVGFERMYRLLLRERDALLAPEGPLRRFIPVEIRALLRSTQIYYKILQESYHPDLLRDGLERERYFDNLWAGMKRRPFLEKVASAERTALHRGDIPRFSTRPDSLELSSGEGEPLIKALWRTGMEVVEERLHGMGEGDLERHLWWIRCSLLSSLPELPREPERPRAVRRESATPVERSRLVAAAQAVGDRIATLAASDEGMMGWLGLRQDSLDTWTFSPMTLDVYGGMSGVGLFLAQLARLSGEERFTRLARHVGDNLRKLAERSRPRVKVLGAFEGWGGVIYTLTQLGVLFDEPAVLAEAESLVEVVPPLVEQDKSLDIIAGVAGCIGGLLALHHTTGSPAALAAAVRCGEHLLATRQPQEKGSGWMTLVKSPQPLSGFSHGASGMAWALEELAAASGQARFSAVADEALAYERTLFSPEQLNWRDTRASGHSMQAWCHGAPGIGLARARMLRHRDTPLLREELRAAVAGTLEQGFGYNDSLCHGDLGNLELLVAAQAVGESPEVGAFIQGTLEALLARATRREWRCATPLGTDTPGLMIGLAGIGWGLLRFAEPGEVSSVLTLDPPAAKKHGVR
ncbi:type 2 lanthipeptide synthetase LanM family protein [Archangium sp.]|uniref:type 2 lanthipeptide synthetase LanM family protein n=1 Tax=Archangium sp. TaxID=1872627 RepID=UPI00389B1572